MWIRHVEIEDFAARLREDERSAATVEKYCREAARFAAWLEGREVNQVLALEYKAQLAESRTPAGVNGAVAALNKLFSFLGLEGCRLKAVKQQRRIFRDEARELTEHEYRRLLAAARRRGNERLLLLMETVCSTGIRISELRFFTVESAKRGRVEVDNKGKRRTVFLPGKLQTLLLRYARKRGIAEGPVFVTRTGRPLDRSNIWSEMKGLCREAGVEPGKVFPHNLRHLFATVFYQRSKDIARLADVLGHSSIETTRLYLLTTGQEHQRALDRLGIVS